MKFNYYIKNPGEHSILYDEWKQYVDGINKNNNSDIKLLYDNKYIGMDNMGMFWNRTTSVINDSYIELSLRDFNKARMKGLPDYWIVNIYDYNKESTLFKKFVEYLNNKNNNDRWCGYSYKYYGYDGKEERFNGYNCGDEMERFYNNPVLISIQLLIACQIFDKEKKESKSNFKSGDFVKLKNGKVGYRFIGKSKAHEGMCNILRNGFIDHRPIKDLELCEFNPCEYDFMVGDTVVSDKGLHIVAEINKTYIIDTIGNDVINTDIIKVIPKSNTNMHEDCVDALKYSIQGMDLAKGQTGSVGLKCDCCIDRGQIELHSTPRTQFLYSPGLKFGAMIIDETVKFTDGTNLFNNIKKPMSQTKIALVNKFVAKDSNIEMVKTMKEYFEANEKFFDKTSDRLVEMQDKFEELKTELNTAYENDDVETMQKLMKRFKSIKEFAENLKDSKVNNLIDEDKKDDDFNVEEFFNNDETEE